MSFGKVVHCLLIISIALASGMPQDQSTASRKSDEPLPFIQLTNGGIRVNFAGYHAEAGLGGLLRGTGTGGGLHASAGTPWGAHAGAGLGGQLNGEDGNLGGGLYARAGLGRGRPEAAAGIGGTLDGSGRSAKAISGGMYAGATPGGQGIGVYLGNQDIAVDGIGPFADGSNPAIVAKEVSMNAGANPGATVDATIDASASADAAASATKPSKGRTNIQIIPSRSESARKRKEKVAFAAAALPADIPADEKAKSQNKEIRREATDAVKPSAPPAPPLAEAGLVGSLYVGTAPIVKSVNKNVVLTTAPAIVVPAPVAAPIANISSSTAAIAKNLNTVVSRPVYPRWYFRKRFWTSPRKVFYATAPTATADSQSAPSDMVGRVFINVAGNDSLVAKDKAYSTSGSLFDDIFNIPISTLSAVNQLLRNNVG